MDEASGRFKTLQDDNTAALQALEMADKEIEELRHHLQEAKEQSSQDHEVVPHQAESCNLIAPFN